MTSALDTALAHFAQRKNSKLDVPEWGITVHYSPLGMAARQRVLAAAGKGGDAVSFAQAKLVAEHARDAGGKPLFGEPTPDVIHKLQHEVDPNVIDRIARAIVGAPTEDEAAKN